MPRRRAVLRLMLSAEEHLFEPGKLVPELHRLLRPEASEVLQLPLHRRKPGRIDRQVELRPVGLAREERPQEGSSSTFARTLLDVGDSLSRTSSSASSGTGSTVMPLNSPKYKYSRSRGWGAGQSLIGRATGRERVCQSVYISWGAVSLKKK